MYISSLPPANQNSTLTVEQWNTRYADNLNNKDINIVYFLLEKHILQWKAECSPDISHFEKILVLSTYEDLITRVLYECMEKNEFNLNYFKNRAPYLVHLTHNTHTISPTQYPTLYKMVSTTNLDYISNCKGTIECLNLLQKIDLATTIKTSIKEKTYNKKYRSKLLDINNSTDLNIVKYVLNNMDYTQIFSGTSDILNTNAQLKLLIYLVKHGYKKLKLQSNLDIILNNLDKLFNTEKKLEFLTGLLMLTTARNSIQQKSISSIYEATFPKEYQLTKTLLSLEVMDFNTVISNVRTSNKLQNIESVECPQL